MAIKITKEELSVLDPCDRARRLALFGRKKSMDVKQALAAGASISDILWVAGRLGYKYKCVEFALAVAQRVAHLSPDTRVQAALDATGAWLRDPNEETRKAAYANAAYAAAYANAYANAAYANAAYAAAYANAPARAAAYANAAAYAAAYANAAADAANAAADAAADAAYANAAAYAANAAADAAYAKEVAAQKAILIAIFA